MKTLKISSRTQRMERFRKLNGKPAINLVSLMDIFSILVFFLLISSSTVQQLPSNKDLTLPTSRAEKVPRETLVVTITRDRILVQGMEVAKIDDVLSAASPVIEGLEKALAFHASKASDVMKNEAAGLPLTIMGDENIPYRLLRKILMTCRQTNYRSIAFSALQTVDE